MSEPMFKEWQPVPGFAQQVRERFAKEKIRGWVWRGGPVEIEAFLVERQKVEFWNHRANEWVVKADQPTYFLLSEPQERPADSLDPFTNFMENSQDIDHVWGRSRKELAERVLAIVTPQIARLQQHLNCVQFLAGICREIVQ